MASRKIIQPKALFGLFGGAKKAATGVKVEELQADLIKLVAVGANASPATLLQIQNLVRISLSNIHIQRWIVEGYYAGSTRVDESGELLHCRRSSWHPPVLRARRRATSFLGITR